MISPFCHIGLHNWEYRKEKHECVGHPHGRNVVRIAVRECKWCEHREYHSIPKSDGKFGTWKSFDDISKDDCVDIKKLTDEL
jgi:hypothetical protein